MLSKVISFLLKNNFPDSVDPFGVLLLCFIKSSKDDLPIVINN